MIIISNGFGQFHMARLAEKLSERGVLSRYFTGGYPRPGVLDRFTRLVGRGIRRRHTGRAIRVPLALIRDFWIPELPHQVSQLLGRTKFSRTADWAEVLALRIYAFQAGRELVRAARGTSGLQIYHYRAGYGGYSVSLAKKMGLRAVCDHSIAHPRVLEGLVSGGPSLSTTLSRFWGLVEQDISAADHIIVNSSFVRDTMASAGVDLGIVSVAYTAVDPAFVKVLDSNDPGHGVLFSHIAFPGTLELRKGIDLAINAASLESSGARWVLYGEWAQDAQHLRRSLPSNVVHSGKLDRENFAAMLAERPVVVFPSRAEGSARVLAEALVAGCFVITTQAAGSLVRDGIDGRVFELATSAELAQAVRDYMALSPAEKYSKSEATRVYARRVLSEEAYADAVRDAYATATGRGA